MDEDTYDKWTQRTTLGRSNLYRSAFLLLDNGHHRIEPRYGLGVLDQLPLELLSEILVHVDLRTLTDFRRVNQRAMQVIDSIPKYQVIVEHGAQALQCILSMETGGHASCLDLFHMLCNPYCEECGDLGEMIYLPTCKRICESCSKQKSKYLPLLAAEAMREFGVSQRHLKTIPRMRNVGHYGLGYYRRRRSQCQVRHTFFDPEALCLAAMSLHRPVSTTEQRVTGVSSEDIADFQNTLRLQPEDKVWPKGCQRPKQHQGQRIMDDVRRIMAVTEVPWVNPSTNAPEWPVHCNGCSGRAREGPHPWNRKFTKASFADHIKELGDLENKRSPWGWGLGWQHCGMP